MRRSLIAAVDIPAGHIIEESDLYAKRPGTGISPDKENLVIGKTAKDDIEADTLIQMENLLG